MTDEGMFRPPGAPGGGLDRRKPAGPPPSSAPGPAPTNDQHPHDHQDQEHNDPAGPAPYRRWRPEVLPDTAWRLTGAAAGVLLYVVAGLPWWRTSPAQCARTYPAGDPLRDACAHVTASGSRAAVWGREEDRSRIWR